MANDHSKILWQEGMTLDPHHFQQWDRYQAHRLQSRIQALTRNHWGLISLVIDEDRLSNGDFGLVECEGVLSDGYVFDLPNDGSLPPPRSVSDEFDPSAEKLNVYLCIPVLRNGSNLQTSENQSAQLTRFQSDVLAITDENTGRDERTIEVGRPNFQLRFGSEQLEGFSTIQIASVVRSPGGYFALDDHFIPTGLVLSASKQLRSLASKALELSLAKSGSLDERRLSTTSQRQLTPSDITAIGLLATVNRHIPVMKSQLSGPGCHPEDLYLTLLSLAGELSAYTSDASFHPREFPEYDHADLTSCFNKLSEMLAGALGGAQPARNYRQLPLTTIRESLYEAEISEEELNKADFILSVKSSDVPEARLVAEFPTMLRIAAPEMIENVLQAYTRALVVEHTSRLPVGMPEDPTASYFKLERAGPFWEGICDSKKLAIFVPAEFGELELKLAAILRG